jgi:hypothetical protein
MEEPIISTTEEGENEWQLNDTTLIMFFDISGALFIVNFSPRARPSTQSFTVKF